MASAVAMGLGSVAVLAPVGAAVWAAGAPAYERLRAFHVLAVGAVLLGLFLPVDVHSNDVHRYLWEGRVVLDGANPYVLAPEHPGLAALRDDRYDRIAHPELPSLYPPLAQASFALAAALGWQEAGYRNAMLVLQLVLAGLVCAWLGSSGRPPGRAAWLAWSPVAVAAGAMGHVDVLMALALVGFAWSWERGLPRAACVSLALAILAKTVALLLVPWALWRRPREVLLWTLPVVAIGVLPFVLSGGVVGSLHRFAAEFQFNASLYEGLRLVAGDAARPVAAGLLASWIAAITLRCEDVVEAAVLALAGLLWVAPTVHSWYLLWPLALLPAAPARPWRAPLLAWTASVTLTAPLYVRAARGDAFLPARLYEVLVGLEYLLPLAVGALGAAMAGCSARVSRRVGAPTRCDAPGGGA